MSLAEDTELRDKETKELEELAKKLSLRDKSKPLESTGNSVYGYVDNKKTYLMSLEEYTRLKELCFKYKDHRRSQNSQAGSTMKTYKECDKLFRESNAED